MGELRTLRTGLQLFYFFLLTPSLTFPVRKGVDLPLLVEESCEMHIFQLPGVKTCDLSLAFMMTIKKNNTYTYVKLLIFFTLNISNVLLNYYLTIKNKSNKERGLNLNIIY